MGRRCYLYILSNPTYRKKVNAKIGVSYDPHRRCGNIQSEYGTFFSIYKTYECERGLALRIEREVVRALQHKRIDKKIEFFEATPEEVDLAISAAVESLGAEYAHSYHTA